MCKAIRIDRSYCSVERLSQYLTAEYPGGSFGAIADKQILVDLLNFQKLEQFVQITGHRKLLVLCVMPLAGAIGGVINR